MNFIQQPRDETKKHCCLTCTTPKKSVRKLNYNTNDEINMEFISINIKWNAQKLYIGVFLLL